MKTYTFNVVVEPDEDRWYAECPVLVHQGASTWGYTREEALRNIEDVVRMVVESLIEHGEPVPEAIKCKGPSILALPSWSDPLYLTLLRPLCVRTRGTHEGPSIHRRSQRFPQCLCVSVSNLPK